eukprot:TRINITY_DN9040_c0_g1_i1.p1 TRINITY_DN9040_c0_g1~~TRINITY_DN9040_c0_g1_i1.p1  ORF type:complete len:411 (+),score=103.08 TRINITY_DN9040_c0_g1_i1:51-1283(+)
MPVETEFYEILGVSVDADEHVIKRAYKRLALKYHPDKCRDPEGEHKFKQVGEAYEVLSDPDKRNLYDKHGKKGLEEGGGGGGMDASDIFSRFFGGGGRPRGEPKPKDIVHELAVSLEDYYNGRTRKIAATRDRLCEPCKGTGINPETNKERESFKCMKCKGKGAVIALRELAPGFMQQTQVQCGDCSGKGYSIPADIVCTNCNGRQIMKERKILEVHIEKGMKRGDHITFEGEGDQIPGVRLSGNILIVLGHKPHAFFQRRGRHLFIDHEVTLNEALTGFHLPIEHLDGRQILIKTRPGQVLDPQRLWVIDREGMPVKGTGGCEKGSLVINLSVKFPEKLNAKQIAGLQEALGKPDEVEKTAEHEECTLAPYVPKKKPRRHHGFQHGGIHVMHDDDGMGGMPQGATCQHQ